METTMSKILNVFLPGILILFIFGMFLIQPTKKYSEAERRALIQKPVLGEKNLSSGVYASDYELFLMDQFPGRDFFRTLKAEVARNGFLKKDNNGYYYAKGHLSKIEYPMNGKKLQSKIELQKNVLSLLPEDFGGAIYFSLIPDKNYFLAKDNGYLSMDYQDYADEFKNAFSNVNYIDIFDTLSLESYYVTDPHWKQEKLLPVSKKISTSMGVGYYDEYTIKQVETPFYGAYYQQSKIKANPDVISYLTNAILENCEVTSFDTGKAKRISMYTMEKENGKDLYEIFLGGSDALITIVNEDCSESKELIVFRDSFGSSLVPLLVPGYQKITLVDLRYIKPELLKNYLEFKTQDILFLYSTL